MPERVRTRQGQVLPPGASVSVGLLAALLLWAWYVWIFAPTIGIERERAISGSAAQGLTAALRSVGT